MKLGPDCITNESFSDAVVNAFREVYELDETELIEISAEGVPSKKVEDVEVMIAYVQKQKTELLGWEWLYGQTPEFTHSLSKTFSWGYVVSLKLPCSVLGDDSVSGSKASFKAWRDKLGGFLDTWRGLGTGGAGSDRLALRFHPSYR